MIAEQQKCLDGATLADLLAGRMPTERFSIAIEHIESCSQCMRAAEENPHYAKLPWLLENPDSSSGPKFEIEPECSAVVGNLLIQPVPSHTDRLNPHAAALPLKEMLGPYRLISSLGSGGMGTVFLAEHQRLKRHVALKLLPRDKLARSGWLDRFNREMTAIAALEHPNVVRALDAGDEDQWHYLVMEYLDGLDLNRVARRLAEIPVAASCEIIRQAALGLAAIHEAGMIHRDIKPSNIFLTRAGCVKLLDLGLVLDGESPLLADERLTTVGYLMGTLPFMAREQLEDARNVDWRADIYSLGATLYRLLGGKPPYGSAENLARTIQAINATEAPSLGKRRSDLPVELVAIVDRMLSSNMLARPQSAIEVAELLQPFCDPSAPKELIRSAMQSKLEEEFSITTLMPIVAPTSGSPPRSRWSGWVAAAMLPIAFAAGIFVTISTDKGTLVIESDEPNASVKIVQGEKAVEQLEVIQNTPSTLTLRSGKYQIELTGIDSDKLEVNNNQVLLSRGERQVVKVSRRESIATIDPVQQTVDMLGPLMQTLSVPAKTFQGKSLAEWSAILSRERSGEVLASAMEAVHVLVDTPEEKLDAMRLFLQTSRHHGMDYAGQSSGGRGGGGGNLGGSGVALPPAKLFMNALVRYFPKLFSASPEVGLAAIANEFENGTVQSKLACLGLMPRILPNDFSLIASGPKRFIRSKSTLVKIAQTSKGRALLLKLDSLIGAAISSNSEGSFMQQNTLEGAIRLRMAMGYAMELDVTTNPQIMNWANEVLWQTRRSQSKETTEANAPIAANAATDADTALTNYNLLQGTALDLSPLLYGLTQFALNPSHLAEVELAVAEICRRNPMECALVLAPHFSSRATQQHFGKTTLSKISLGTFAKNHPRPMDAIEALLKVFDNPVKEDGRWALLETIRPFLTQLLVRVVLEIDLVNDADADWKLSYAAFSFGNFEIPEEDSAKVMEILFARRRDGESDSSLAAEVTPDVWYRTVTRESKPFITNSRMLLSKLLACCNRNPKVALKALVKEVQLGNANGTMDHRKFFSFVRDPLVAGTAKERRPAIQVDLIKTKPVTNVLQSDDGTRLVTELAAALDMTIEQQIKGIISRKSSSEDVHSLSQLVCDRLILARFLDQAPKDFEPMKNALQYLATLVAESWLPIMEEGIAELVGYENYPIERLQLLVKTKEVVSMAKDFVARVRKAAPAKFGEHFLAQLERVKRCDDATDLFGIGYERSLPTSVWKTVMEELPADSLWRDRVLTELSRIVDILRDHPEEKDGKEKVQVLRWLMESN